MKIQSTILKRCFKYAAIVGLIGYATKANKQTLVIQTRILKLILESIEFTLGTDLIKPSPLARLMIIYGIYKFVKFWSTFKVKAKEWMRIWKVIIKCKNVPARNSIQDNDSIEIQSFSNRVPGHMSDVEKNRILKIANKSSVMVSSSSSYFLVPLTKVLDLDKQLDDDRRVWISDSTLPMERKDSKLDVDNEVLDIWESCRPIFQSFKQLE